MCTDICDINSNGQKDSSGIIVMIKQYEEYINNIFSSVTIVTITTITKRHLTVDRTENCTISSYSYLIVQFPCIILCYM